jgi:hypothetical protein
MLMDYKADDLGSEGHFENVIKTDAEEGIQDVFYVVLVFELTEEGGGKEGYVVLIIGKPLKGVGNSDLGMVRAAPDTFPAIDAPFLHDRCFAVMNPDRLGGTSLNAGSAALALFKVERYRVKVMRHAHLP